MARAALMRLKKKPTRKPAPKRRASARALKPAAPKPRFAAESVSFTLPVGPDGVEPLLGAAYLMTDRCYAALGGDRKTTLEITLWGKRPLDAAGLRALAADFARELESQRLRWAIARHNLPVREYVQELAVQLAQRPPEPPPPETPDGGEELSEAQRKEIDALIAEVESEIAELKQSPAGKDPEGVAKTWEEKHKS